MKDKPLPRDVHLLLDAVQRMPERDRLHLLPFLDTVVDSTKRRQRVLSLVSDALEDLRLDLKYLMFDLEATKRERDELRK
jgi:hypothetical protein